MKLNETVEMLIVLIATVLVAILSFLLVTTSFLLVTTYGCERDALPLVAGLFGLPVSSAVLFGLPGSKA